MHSSLLTTRWSESELCAVAGHFAELPGSRALAGAQRPAHEGLNARLTVNHACPHMLWIDACVCAQVDHQTLIEGFWEWQRQEYRQRGFMPG